MGYAVKLQGKELDVPLFKWDTTMYSGDPYGYRNYPFDPEFPYRYVTGGYGYLDRPPVANNNATLLFARGTLTHPTTTSGSYYGLSVSKINDGVDIATINGNTYGCHVILQCKKQITNIQYVGGPSSQTDIYSFTAHKNTIAYCHNGIKPVPTFDYYDLHKHLTLWTDDSSSITNMNYCTTRSETFAYIKDKDTVMKAVVYDRDRGAGVFELSFA